ncbi:DNA-directed RNA polymerase III subunit RPC9-like [Argonauta hians]
MELLNESSALLSNYEVYTLLLDIQAGRNGQTKPTKSQTNLATVTYETVKYLEGTTCKHLNGPAVKEFVRRLAPFKLTKAEKLQLLNQRPTTAVEIQLLIEESEERLTETQVYQLLDVVSKFLPDGSLELSEEEEEEEEEKEMVGVNNNDEEEEMEEEAGEGGGGEGEGAEAGVEGGGDGEPAEQLDETLEESVEGGDGEEEEVEEEEEGGGGSLVMDIASTSVNEGDEADSS